MDEQPTCPTCGAEYSSWSAVLACEIDDLDTRRPRNPHTRPDTDDDLPNFWD